MKTLEELEEIALTKRREADESARRALTIAASIGVWEVVKMRALIAAHTVTRVLHPYRLQVVARLWYWRCRLAISEWRLRRLD